MFEAATILPARRLLGRLCSDTEVANRGFIGRGQDSGTVRSSSEVATTQPGGFYMAPVPVREPAIVAAASAFLNVIDGDPVYEQWYRGIWNFIAIRFIDHESGGCRAQIDDILRPNSGPFFGKVDIYHALRSLPNSNSTNNWERDKMPWGWRVLHGRANGVRNQHISVYHSLQCPKVELAP